MSSIKNNKFFVSHTKLNTYKQCPMQYYYKYMMRLEKKVSRRAFYAGEDIHKLVELFYLHRTPELLEQRKALFNTHLEKKPVYVEDPANRVDEFKELYDKWNDVALELWGDTLTWREYITNIIEPRVMGEGDAVKQEIGYNYINDLIKIIGQYEYYYSADKITFLDLEHKKYSELGTFNNKQVVLSYISDGVVLLNGEQMLVEHKSFTSEAMSFENTWLNVQTAEYVTELNKVGWDIKGVVWDNIKSKAPKDPNILKSGLYGKQSQDVTLFSLISPSIIMKSFEAVVEEIQRVMTEAQELGIVNNYQFFLSRHTTRFNENAVKNIRKDTTKVIETITADYVPYYRNMGWASCNYCGFKDLCQQEMLGYDTEDIINTLYIKKGEL